MTTKDGGTMSENFEIQDVDAAQPEAELVPLSAAELDAVGGGLAFPFIQ
jgi:hypothetical protein